jgi:hypothetical protein
MHFDVAGDRARQHQAQMDAAGLRPLDLEQHPLRVFLWSFLTWFAAADGAELQQGDVPQNTEQAVARMQAIPAEQREEMLRGPMAEADEVERQEEVELEAALQVEAMEAQDEPAPDRDVAVAAAAAGGFNYDEYQFDDEEQQ